MNISPRIVISGEDQDYNVFIDIFKKNQPKNVVLEFEQLQKKTLQLKPSYQHLSRCSDLDIITKAPNILLYVFSCAKKDDYLKKYQEKIKLWFRANSRPYIHPICIFLNDPKVTKSKSIFSGFSNFYQLLTEEIPNLQTLLISPSGEVQEESVQKLWTFLESEIARSYIDRVNWLNELIKGPPSLDIFRRFLDLSLLYEQVALFHQAVNNSQQAFDLVEANPQLFTSFFSDKSFNYPFDFAQSADNFEEEIAENMASQYDLLYVIFKRQVQNLLFMENPGFAIELGYTFLVRTNDKVKTGIVTQVEEPQYHFWLCQSIYDITSACMKEFHSGHRETADKLVSSIQWYIQEFKVLCKEVETPESRHNHKFPILSKIVATNESQQNEIIAQLSNMIDVTAACGFHRLNALANLELLKYQNIKKEVYNKAIFSLIIYGYSSYLPDLNEEKIKSLTLPEQIVVACALVRDKKQKYRDLGIKFLNDLMTIDNHQHADQQYEISQVLPIYYEFKQEKPFVQFQEVDIDVICRTAEDLTFHTDVLKIGFIGANNFMVWLTAKDVTIKNGNKITLHGGFRNSGGYFPIYHRYQSNDHLTIHHTLPLNDFVIHVEPQPLPVDIQIRMPDFLLPNRFQHAQLKIQITRVIEELKLEVSGITFLPQSIRLESGKLLEPTNGLCFNNVPPGNHILYLPVNPVQSGVLKVDTEACGQKVTRISEYTVSDFVELKVLYKKSKNIAELTACLKARSKITITDVTFFDEKDQEVKCKSFGIPMELETNNVSSLFILESQVEAAQVMLQQESMRPFSLRISVESISSDDSQIQQVSPPLTPFVPLDFKL